MANHIYHDLDSARKVLPEVRKLMNLLMGLHRSLEVLDGIEVENESDDPKLEVTIAELNMEFHKKMYLYYTYLRKLVALGAIVKDLDMGLVDFYSKHNGKDILLCWMYGEEEISHWHSTTDGFDERMPIDIL